VSTRAKPEQLCNPIVWPDSTTEFEIEGGQITSSKPYGESGGIENFFEPLGLKPPAAL
jgi:hypothetical protein